MRTQEVETRNIQNTRKIVAISHQYVGKGESKEWQTRFVHHDNRAGEIRWIQASRRDGSNPDLRGATPRRGSRYVFAVRESTGTQAHL